MGTQQLLLIVLGVIIVGIAIAVGINLFASQSYNANQQGVAQEMSTYASMVMQWWKTPPSQGGKGQLPLADGDAAKIAGWCGFGSAENSVLTTDTGSFAVTSATAGGSTIVLTGCGTEKRNNAYPKVTTTIDFSASTPMSSAISTDANGNPLD